MECSGKTLSILDTTDNTFNLVEQHTAWYAASFSVMQGVQKRESGTFYLFIRILSEEMITHNSYMEK